MEVHSPVLEGLFGNLRPVVVPRKPPLEKKKVFKLKKSELLTVGYVTGTANELVVKS